MIYSEILEKNLTKKDRHLLVHTGKLLWAARDNCIGDEKRDPVLNCHSIRRSLCLEITDGSIHCVDGVYIGTAVRDGKVDIYTYSHSWLLLESGNILDPYPVAIMSCNPILVVNKGDFESCGGGHYMKDSSVTEKISGREVWRKARVLQKLFHKKRVKAAA